MKVLVTGGGGFVGAAVTRQLLARGDAVTLFARGDYPALRDLGARTVRGDLTDLEAVTAAVSGQDVVVHTAAKAGAWGDPREYWNTNVLGTQHVLDACRRTGVRRLVYTSTPSVVHAGKDINGGNETLPYASRYRAPYPATKAEAERRVLAANAPSLLVTALRPHLVWGPGDPHLVPQLVARARAGRLALIGTGRTVVDATYIDNAAAAHLCAIDRLAAVEDPEQPPAGRVYFIAQGEPIAIADLVNRIIAAAGLPPVRRRVPLPLALAVSTVIEGIQRMRGGTGEPLLTRFLVEQLATAHWFDLSAARRDLGYRPPVSMTEGLEHLRTWLHDQAGQPQRR